MSSFAGGERQEAESRAEAEADTETKLRALSAFWQRHCKSFSLWFLMLSPETQVETLLQCCSDMPRKRANGGGSATRPSELILPEFYAGEPISLLLFTSHCFFPVHCSPLLSYGLRIRIPTLIKLIRQRSSTATRGED